MILHAKLVMVLKILCAQNVSQVSISRATLVKQSARTLCSQIPPLGVASLVRIIAISVLKLTTV